MQIDKKYDVQTITALGYSQIPTWGERICMPEWDADESIEEVGNSDLNDIVDNEL